MTPTMDMPRLVVEGKGDRHSFIHLLGRHGINLDKDKGPVRVDEFAESGKIKQGITTFLKAGGKGSRGFVLDADESLPNLWNSLRSLLIQCELQPPQNLPSEGYIASLPRADGHIGIWIMPDNVTSPGRLEDFLCSMIPEGNPLFPLAQRSTMEAKGLGAPFLDQDRRKAELHCWLAWQKEPGHPFGTAIKADTLSRDSNAARCFVAWFRRLYGL